MKRAFYTILLCGSVYFVGCGFTRWATTGDTHGKIPILEEAPVATTEALDQIQKYGLVVGGIGGAFSILKSIARLYAQYQAQPKTPA